MIASDTSALSPSGIRLGTSAMTTRGFATNEFIFVADIIKEILELGLRIQTGCGTKLVEFIEQCENYKPEISTIQNKIKLLCFKYPIPI